MSETTDWHDWQSRYADEGSALSQRLRLVQHHIGDWLDERTESPLRVLSVCAGQGYDLIGVLARRQDAGRVRAELIENDLRNVAAAREGAAAAGLGGITVTCADAGDFAAYRTPSRPIWSCSLACWATSVTRTYGPHDHRAAAAVCAGCTVIWTRTRRAADLTPTVRRWFASAGFAERAFHAPPGVLFSVGVHQLHARPDSPPRSGRIFTFTT